MHNYKLVGLAFNKSKKRNSNFLSINLQSPKACMIESPTTSIHTHRDILQSSFDQKFIYRIFYVFFYVAITCINMLRVQKKTTFQHLKVIKINKIFFISTFSAFSAPLHICYLNNIIRSDLGCIFLFFFHFFFIIILYMLAVSK